MRAKNDAAESNDAEIAAPESVTRSLPVASCVESAQEVDIHLDTYMYFWSKYKTSPSAKKGTIQVTWSDLIGGLISWICITEAIIWHCVPSSTEADLQLRHNYNFISGDILRYGRHFLLPRSNAAFVAIFSHNSAAKNAQKRSERGSRTRKGASHCRQLQRRGKKRIY